MRLPMRNKDRGELSAYRCAAASVLKDVRAGATFAVAHGAHEPVFLAHPPVREKAAWEAVLALLQEPLVAEVMERFAHAFRVLRLQGVFCQEATEQAYREVVLPFWGDQLPVGSAVVALRAAEEVEASLPHEVRGANVRHEAREAVRRCTAEATARRLTRQRLAS